MINKWLAILLFLTVTTRGYTQERKNLQGRVVAAGNPAQNIFIINKNTGTEVKSASDGVFTIPAKIGDRITAYSNTAQVREFAITANSFSQNPYTIEIDPIGTDLDEVVVTGITSESLGLVPKNQKKNTQMERKLYTTGEFKPSMLLGLLGGSMPLDPLINAINGRTQRVRKELQIERQQLMAEQINNLFTDDELVSFGLPAQTARGFIFYIVEDIRLADSVKAGNTEMVRLLLVELADKYTKLQAE